MWLQCTFGHVFNFLFVLWLYGEVSKLAVWGFALIPLADMQIWWIFGLFWRWAHRERLWWISFEMDNLAISWICLWKNSFETKRLIMQRFWLWQVFGEDVLASRFHFVKQHVDFACFWMLLVLLTNSCQKTLEGEFLITFCDCSSFYLQAGETTTTE